MKRRFISLLIILLLIIAPDCLLCTTHIVILHTNDHHGHPVKYSYRGIKGVGGLPARATLVKEIRKREGEILLLDAGDINTGMPESNLFSARPDILGYNYIGYDAMTLGNHEFDNPLSVLKTQMDWAKFPFISANLLKRDGSYLSRPYVIEEIKGKKIAILGLTTPFSLCALDRETRKMIRIEDPVVAANRIVPELKRRCDLLIALTHLGIYEDDWERGSIQLAKEVDGIDLIIDGHSHTKMDHPIWVKNRYSGKKIPIVQAWKWGLVVGRADIWMDGSKDLDLEFKCIPINLDRRNGHIPEDRNLLKLLSPYVREVEKRLSEIVGYAEHALSSKGSREEETPLGDLIADSMLHFTKRWNVDFAIQNAGGIRADLPRGPIRLRKIYEILPFDDTVVVLRLSGRDLREMFGHIATLPPGHGGFPQVSDGIYFEIDRARGECRDIKIRGKRLNPKKIYTIATNSYLSEGGDGYHMLRRCLFRYDTSRFQRDVFAEYIRQLGTVRKKECRRIKKWGG